MVKAIVIPTPEVSIGFKVFAAGNFGLTVDCVPLTSVTGWTGRSIHWVVDFTIDGTGHQVTDTAELNDSSFILLDGYGFSTGGDVGISALTNPITLTVTVTDHRETGDVSNEYVIERTAGQVDVEETVSTGDSDDVIILLDDPSEGDVLTVSSTKEYTFINGAYRTSKNTTTSTENPGSGSSTYTSQAGVITLYNNMMTDGGYADCYRQYNVPDVDDAGNKVTDVLIKSPCYLNFDTSIFNSGRRVRITLDKNMSTDTDKAVAVGINGGDTAELNYRYGYSNKLLGRGAVGEFQVFGDTEVYEAYLSGDLVMLN